VDNVSLLCQYRIIKNLTYEDLAIKIGVSDTTLFRFINKNFLHDVKTLYKINRFVIKNRAEIAKAIKENECFIL
jgi:transcriptional regulator with XRE-family HTH domain